MASQLTDFLSDLRVIPWLKNVGQPSPLDRDVLRIYSWDEWPGPEEPGSEIQASLYLRWKEELTSDDPQGNLPALFEEIQSEVRALARSNVAYDDNQDAWYGPNASVWAAGWLAAVIGCRVARGKSVGEYNREDQWAPAAEWHWFRHGHWPCTYFWSWRHATLEQVARYHNLRWLIVL